jgi:4-amino-4-deoxy-L-arabinose transferase-like glycosyltransferase
MNRRTITRVYPAPQYRASHRAKRPSWRGRETGVTVARGREAGMAVAILVAATLIRLWQVGSKPGWQSDEPVYTSVAANVARYGTLNEHIQYGLSWSPFLFHPPFYFLVLAGWFDLFGVGVPQARVLAVLMTLIMFTLLCRVLWKLHGPRVALVTLTLVAFDGWLLYIQRVSYIENTLFVLIVAGLLMYQRALERPGWLSFLVAGMVIGCATVFKYTGIYLIVTVGIHWLIIRRERRNHLILLGGWAFIIALYVAVMTPLFHVGPNNWFVSDNVLQFERVTGLRASGGTLTSPLALLYLLAHQYAVFLPSLIAAVAAFVLVVRRAVQCVRTRSVAPLERNALLFSWTAAAIIVFGISTLRYQQYFALILVPMYCFLWTELLTTMAWHPKFQRTAATVAAVVLLAGLGSFYLRVVDRNDNVLAQTRQYVLTKIPQNDVVLTPEQIGDEIDQRWCTLYRAPACRYAATYVVTYITFLQGNPPHDPFITDLLRESVPVKTFRGFKETVTVWRIR